MLVDGVLVDGVLVEGISVEGVLVEGVSVEGVLDEGLLLEGLLEEVLGFSGTGSLTCSLLRSLTIELVASGLSFSAFVVEIISEIVELTKESKSELVFCARFLHKYAFA